MPATLPADEFVRFAVHKLRDQHAQIVRCVGLLTDDELWQRSNAHTNSVGNLLLHLTGNVRQWIVGGLRGQTVPRDRPAEFAARGPVPREEVLGTLAAVCADAQGVIQGLSAAALATRRVIQGYEVSQLAAVFHVVEHFSFHTGQIVHITKVLKDVDVSLYGPQGQRLAGSKP